MSDQDPNQQAWKLLGHATQPLVPSDFPKKVTQAALRKSRDSRFPGIAALAAAAVLAIGMVLPMLHPPRTDEMDRLARIEAALNWLDQVEAISEDGQAEALLLAQLDDPSQLSDDDFLAIFY